MKKHGDMELKKFTFHEDESSPIFALHDFMKTKIERDENVIKVEKNGQTRIIDYSKHDDVSMSDEPQTKLMWPNFEPVQNVIDAQTTLTTTEY